MQNPDAVSEEPKRFRPFLDRWIEPWTKLGGVVITTFALLVSLASFSVAHGVSNRQATQLSEQEATQASSQANQVLLFGRPDLTTCLGTTKGCSVAPVHVQNYSALPITGIGVKWKVTLDTNQGSVKDSFYMQVPDLPPCSQVDTAPAAFQETSTVLERFAAGRSGDVRVADTVSNISTFFWDAAGRFWTRSTLGPPKRLGSIEDFRDLRFDPEQTKTVDIPLAVQSIAACHPS